jgi:CubicO group peptidase (beta-lactamase class C family)
VAEVAAGGVPLRTQLQTLIDGAGIEGTFHVSCDRDWVPIVSGGGWLTARDLARYGLIFARPGLRGADGISQLGSRRLLEDTLRRRSHQGRVVEPGGTGGGGEDDGVAAAEQPPQPPQPPVWYANQLQSNGRWVGHGGYGGQWMAADPVSGASLAFFSVFFRDDEEEGTEGGGSVGDLTAMTSEIFALLE